MAWTEQQQRAIELDGKNILVSAAAGSGKTAVLTERVTGHLMREEGLPDAWNVDELLIVTFTKAAAAEMSERIGKRLQQAISEELEKSEPDKKLIRRMEKQIILLSSASISTIDSFCQKIVKNNFAEIDLDPKFRVANDNELLLLKQDVLDELFEERYASEDDALLYLAEKYGNDRGDDNLYAIVLSLYEKAVNQPFPEHWLNSLIDDFAVEADTRLSGYHKWWQVIMDALRSGMENVHDELQHFVQLVESLDDKKARSLYEERLDRIRCIVGKITAALDAEWQDIYDAFRDMDYKETGFLDMPRNKMDIDPEHRKELTACNAEIKDILGSLRSAYILDNEELMTQDLHNLAGDAAAIVDLTLGFLNLYGAAKKEKNIIDYSDMEHFALQILLSKDASPEELKPSEAALALRRRYKEIMVDEYQDTNEVQNTIVSLITGDGLGNLFTVGDVKQSIYGFRSSEPKLFMQKYESYGRETEKARTAHELITLGRNFRSRREVLTAVNFVFAQLMAKRAMEIDYDERAMLNPGEPYGYSEPLEGEILPLGEAVELDIIMEEGLESSEDEPADEESAEALKRFEIEAQYIATRLKELKNSGYVVFDKNLKENNGYRPIQWRDMVVLLRAVKGKAEVLQEILQANDIPVFASLEGGYFQTTEIQVITSLLSVIDNAQQDIPLAAVLYSPLVGLSAEELAELRLSGEDGLYQLLIGAGSPDIALSANIKKKAADFLAQLTKWRQMAQRMGVAELLWHIYQSTGYYDYVGCMPGGLLRQANLRMLITRAEEFENTNFRGLFRFLSFIEKIKDMDTDLSMARTLGENEDVVRVMSIHKSKGLEFPVVVLADMAKGFNTQDLRNDVIVHKDLGLGLANINTEKSVRFPSFARIAVKSKLIQESKAEELRVLYVAMTRAREKLIMTGRVKKGSKAAAKWCSYLHYDKSTILPPYAISGANSYLDWVGMTAARHSDGAAFAEVLGITEEQYRQPLGYMHKAMGSESRWQINLVSGADIRLPAGVSDEAGDILASVIAGKELDVDEAVAQKAADILEWQYDFGGTEELPAKLSVSELKRRFALQDMHFEPVEVSVDVWDKKQHEYAFPRPVFLQRQEEKNKPRRVGAEYGTLMHTVLQHLELAEALSEKNIVKQLSEMIEAEIITEAQSKIVNIEQLVKFFASKIGQRMLTAKKIWRELPFSRMLSAQKYYEQVADDKVEIFNQGVIDVLFEEADGSLILLDYKTDRDTAAVAVKSKYQLQLQLYSEAVESVLGRVPSEKYLYMLRDGSVIQL